MKLTKKYAKNYIVIKPNKSMSSDGWFIDINYHAKKTDKIVETETIIEKDLEHFMYRLKQNGYGEFDGELAG